MPEIFGNKETALVEKLLNKCNLPSPDMFSKKNENSRTVVYQVRSGTFFCFKSFIRSLEEIFSESNYRGC